MLQRLQKEPCGADERSDYSEQVQRAVHEEMKVCADAAGRYASNYNAWSHRIWVLQYMAKGNLKVEWANCVYFLHYSWHKVCLLYI